ncbi:MAG: hypothetical protein ACK4VI_07350 [Alphaproteobacteria bacterium]
MIEFLKDENIWLVFSFAIFCYILWKYGKPAFLRILDGRIETIKTQLQEAESLRIEAQELLAQYQRKQRDAESEAESIIAKAEQGALDIRKNAEKQLNETLQRRESQFKDRLKQMEEQAMQQIREYATNLSIQATTQIIAEKMDNKTQSALIEQSMGAVGKNLQ